MKNFVIITLSVFIISLLFSSSGYAERKRSVVVMPVIAPNLSPAMRVFLTDILIGQLMKSKKYAFLSGKIVEEAIRESFKGQKERGQRCDQVACIKEVSENFGTELVLTSRVIDDGGAVFLMTKIQNISSGETVSQTDEICKSCSNEKLRNLFGEMALKLIGEPSPAMPPTTPSSPQSASQSPPVSRAEPGGSDFSLDDLEKEAERAEAVKSKWNDWLKDMKAGYTKVSSYENRDVSTDKKITAWERFESSFKEDNPYSGEDDRMRSKAKERIADLRKEAKKESKRRAMSKGSGRSEQSGSTYADPTTGMEFVYVKGGCYQMGDTFGDGYDKEKPVHEVCVDDFYMGKYEVTQGQWEGIMGNNPSYFKNGDKYPVEQVSWNDIQDFIKKLNRKGSNKYRLPTEAEWEYACRSGGKKEKYSGSSNVDGVAWYRSNSGWNTHQVGTKAPNSLGLYDMSGNVYEWVQDQFDSNAYKQHSRNNPVVEGSGGNRVARGGNWHGTPRDVRCAYRHGLSPSYRGGLGFRLLRTP